MPENKQINKLIFTDSLPDNLTLDKLAHKIEAKNGNLLKKGELKEYINLDLDNQELVYAESLDPDFLNQDFPEIDSEDSN